MGFNHGWLVQGEAPPHALFSTFKQIIREGEAVRADVSLYFLHWFTDLAGAEPSPLDGSEKFVFKFPHSVIYAFIESFGVLGELAHSTETQVLERYLVEQWRVQHETVDAPSGPGAIALMRLSLQAQSLYFILYTLYLYLTLYNLYCGSRCRRSSPRSSTRC